MSLVRCGRRPSALLMRHSLARRRDHRDSIGIRVSSACTLPTTISTYKSRFLDWTFWFQIRVSSIPPIRIVSPIPRVWLRWRIRVRVRLPSFQRKLANHTNSFFLQMIGVARQTSSSWIITIGVTSLDLFSTSRQRIIMSRTRSLAVVMRLGRLLAVYSLILVMHLPR